jgi:N-acetylmuramic acid 6-phosphate etherase
VVGQDRFGGHGESLSGKSTSEHQRLEDQRLEDQRLDINVWAINVWAINVWNINVWNCTPGRVNVRTCTSGVGAGGARRHCRLPTLREVTDRSAHHFRVPGGCLDGSMSDIELNWSTEQRNPETLDLDTLSTPDLVGAIVAADEVVVPAVRAVADRIAAAVELAVTAIANGGRVHYVGAGTSGRLGVLDAVELFPTYHVGAEVVAAHLAGGDQAMTRAVEGAEDDPEAGAAIVSEAGDHDLVVGIAASGRTPYVRGALAAARERGLPTVLVSSNVAAPLAELADVAILPDTGPEVVTGSTRMKAATAQKLVLNTFSTATMVRLGKTWSNLMINVQATNLKLERRLVHIVEQATTLDADASADLLASAGGDLRVALVAGLSGATVDEARAVAARFAPDPRRGHDPAGIRSAVAELSDRSATASATPRPGRATSA